MKKWVIGIFVVLIIAGMIVLNLVKDNESTFPAASTIASKNAISVKAATIEMGGISSYITAPGNVQEINKAQVFFDTPLRVLDVAVERNDIVEEGEQLVELDTSTLTDELDKLKIQREIQSITLKKLESGQSLLSLETNLTSARNAFDRSQENYQTALDEYNKQVNLFNSGVISQTQLKQYEQAKKDSKAALDNAQINLESAEKTYNSNLGSHDLDLQSQIKNIELMSKQISEIQTKLNKIKNLEKSPLTGVVTEVFITEGGYTMSGQSAFTIIDHKNLEIVAGVDEYSSKDIKPGLEVVITGDALGDKTKLSGTVTAVAPVALQVQSASGVETLIEVTIEPTEGRDILKAGLTVDCDIITHEKNNIPVAEYNILLDDKDRRQYVMLIDQEDMTIKQQYVELGVYSDMIVEIVNGLKAGDMVVVDPQPSLKDGDKVKVVD